MKKYIISEERLMTLLTREANLEALYAGGVDNWSWYYESIRNYIDCDDEVEDLDQAYNNYVYDKMLKEFGDAEIKIDCSLCPAKDICDK